MPKVIRYPTRYLELGGNMDDRELRDQIRLAFPAARFYGSITPCDCEECTDIRKELMHKRWEEVSVALLDRICNPVLLTPEAGQAVPPAYLRRARSAWNAHGR